MSMIKKWRLGVPRALFYYYYAPWWETFLQALGAEVLVSPPTSREIMDLGVKLAVAEACLPVKVYYGHAAWLAGRVDALFVPRLVSVEKKSFICPKLMGLPDMLRAALKPCPPIIDTTINLSHQPEEGLMAAIQGIARALGVKEEEKVIRAKTAAGDRYQTWLVEQQTDRGNTASNSRTRPASGINSNFKQEEDSLVVGVVGHGYLLYDRHLGMDIPAKITRMGGRVIFPENLSPDVIETACRQLPKRLYWTLGRKIMGAALYIMEHQEIDGLIHLTAFGCGPDSLVGELAERYARRRNKPFLLLTLDEHTGEAGLNTRLEAFMDMLCRRRSA